MALQKLTLTIRKGSAENIPIRLESSAWEYATISAVAQTAPLRITASDVPPDGWRTAIMNVKAVAEFGAQNNPPKDGAGFRAHTTGGQLAWRLPVDLGQYESARMNVRDKVGGALLASYSTATGELDLDTANAVLWLRLSEEQTIALGSRVRVFDIELIRYNGDPEHVCAFDSTIAMLDETTTE